MAQILQNNTFYTLSICFIVLLYRVAIQPESQRTMRHADDPDFAVPMVTVSPDLYDAILLAGRAIMVAYGKPRSGVPDAFAARRCLLTEHGDPAPAALLRCMVGG
jgi:hypothetical protein